MGPELRAEARARGPALTVWLQEPRREPSARACSLEGFPEADLLEAAAGRGRGFRARVDGVDAAALQDAGGRRAAKLVRKSGGGGPARRAHTRREPGESWELSDGGDHVVSGQMAPGRGKGLRERSGRGCLAQLVRHWAGCGRGPRSCQGGTTGRGVAAEMAEAPPLPPP